MTKLSELIEELDIDLDVDDDPGSKGTEFDLTKLPEEHREAVKTAIDTAKANNEDLIGQISAMNETIKNLQATVTKPTVEPKPDKVLGIDKDDHYAPALKTLSDKIASLENRLGATTLQGWKKDLASFAKDNPDVFKVKSDMDKLANENPTLLKNLPNLFKLAKVIYEEREEVQKKGRKEYKQKTKAAERGSETVGTPGDRTSPGGDAKSMIEAFDLAQTQLRK